MAPPPRHRQLHSSRGHWRTILPIAGFSFTFYMIWSLYSSRGLRESAIKDLPVQTVVEDTTDPQTRAALSASTRLCFPEANADYYGEEALQSQVVESMDACCAACVALPACNVYVYCHSAAGCGDQLTGTCWLKHARTLDLARPAGSRSEALGWSSGAVATAVDRAAALLAAKQAQETEAARLAALRANASLPLVFLDVAIKGTPQGRIEAVLFPDVSPRSAENFRQLCTGEKGTVPEGREGAGMAYHFKGASFYRIIDAFIDQSGINTESVFGGQFRDDAGGLALHHTRKGLLSMANMGPNTNTAHFSIMMGPAPHLDGSYTIFGQVVAGLEVVDAINALSKGQPENTAGPDAGAVIVDAGELRHGTIVPNLEA
ncbi:CYN52B [Auxenochlorella protothecoides x Auxenochlorella symbiontica]|uniref:PPIase cyclophilin-type domain-containing protein n=1 Tax=Auxenochlorella protothecoides TaxID=3075 RepID=A0A1D2AA88_AUXPR